MASKNEKGKKQAAVRDTQEEELKVQDAMPLWLSHALSEAGIFKTSFSKYGEAYRRELQTPSLRSAC